MIGSVNRNRIIEGGEGGVVDKRFSIVVYFVYIILVYYFILFYFYLFIYFDYFILFIVQLK